MICQSLPMAFSRSIQLLNQGGLRHSWLKFFPSSPSTTSLFQGLEDSTIKMLAACPTLESFSGTMTLPSKLIHVPPRFQDDQGSPLTAHEIVGHHYLSQHYHEDDWSTLQKLGVQEMSVEDFLDDLFSLVEKFPTEYQQMPPKWHSCLAKTLTGLIPSDPGLNKRILDLPLVPLCDGSWITGHAAKQGKAVLPVESGLPVPKGIQLTEVDPASCKSSHRRYLFLMMDIRQASPEAVCDEIVKTHTDRHFVPAHVPLDDLVHQVRFMYQSGWANSTGEELWFTAENGSFRLGSQLYIDSIRPYSATKLLHETRAAFPFLKPEYLAWAGKDQERLVDWLTRNFSLQPIPRLARLNPQSIMMITHEFDYILKYLKVLDILMLLKTYWSYYRRWIAPDEAKDHYGVGWQVGRRVLIQRFSGLPITCRGGKLTQLRDTALPIARYLEDTSLNVGFLDLPNPESEEWEFLRYFNVMVGSVNSMNLSGTLVEPSIRRLQEMRRQTEPVMISNVAAEYQKIHLLANQEQRSIR